MINRIAGKSETKSAKGGKQEIRKRNREEKKKRPQTKLDSFNGGVTFESPKRKIKLGSENGFCFYTFGLERPKYTFSFLTKLPQQSPKNQQVGIGQREIYIFGLKRP